MSFWLPCIKGTRSESKGKGYCHCSASDSSLYQELSSDTAARPTPGPTELELGTRLPHEVTGDRALIQEKRHRRFWYDKLNEWTHKSTKCLQSAKEQGGGCYEQIKPAFLECFASCLKLRLSLGIWRCRLLCDTRHYFVRALHKQHFTHNGLAGLKPHRSEVDFPVAKLREPSAKQIMHDLIRMLYVLLDKIPSLPPSPEVLFHCA